MKERLIILSDLWGVEDAEWLKYYLVQLNSFFDIACYDSRNLADLNITDQSEESIHHQFVNGGIERAVEALLELEKEQITVLAFSVGGTIAWKAALKGLLANKLFAVSSTRLRYEKEKPKCNCKLYFGEGDLNQPDLHWFQELELTPVRVANKEHEMYKEKDFAYELCREIIKNQIRNKIE